MPDLSINCPRCDRATTHVWDTDASEYCCVPCRAFEDEVLEREFGQIVPAGPKEATAR